MAFLQDAEVNPRARDRWKEDRRARKAALRSGTTRLPQNQTSQLGLIAQAAGAHGEEVRRAFSDRDEITDTSYPRPIVPGEPSAGVSTWRRSARILADKGQGAWPSCSPTSSGPRMRVRQSRQRSGNSRSGRQIRSIRRPVSTRVRRLAYLRRELRKSGGGADRRVFHRSQARRLRRFPSRA